MVLCYIIRAMCNFQSIRSAVKNTLLALLFGTESSVSDDISKHLKLEQQRSVNSLVFACIRVPVRYVFSALSRENKLKYPSKLFVAGKFS